MTETTAEASAPVNYMRSPEGIVVPVIPSAFEGAWKSRGFEAVSDDDGLAAVEAQDLAKEQGTGDPAAPAAAEAPAVPVETPTTLPPRGRPVTDSPQA